MGTVYVVRHREAAGNEAHRFIGQTQMELTERGRLQAQAVARRLREEPVQRLLASDLHRAVQTLMPLSHHLGIEIETDPDLREIHNGEWSGLLPAEIEAGWPELWKAYTGGADVDRPGGERWRDVAARVIPVVSPLLAADGVSVVASHGGPSLIVALWAAGIEVDGNIFRSRLAAVDNCSITVIDPGPRLVAFNDVGHLGARPDQRLPFE
ncbi:MAG TPA: histidine phosphatase family protein [Acidimicrobiia bacterium]|nr:histidine phosphatase family protein [Acidimicrobiia bacterium]